MLDHLALEIRIEDKYSPESCSPDGYEHGDGEDAHEEVASGKDVGGDGDGCVCFQYHPQLHSKSYQVQTSGDDSNHDGSSKERTADAGCQEYFQIYGLLVIITLHINK